MERIYVNMRTNKAVIVIIAGSNRKEENVKLNSRYYTPFEAVEELKRVYPNAQIINEKY